MGGRTAIAFMIRRKSAFDDDSGQAFCHTLVSVHADQMQGILAVSANGYHKDVCSQFKLCSQPMFPTETHELKSVRILNRTPINSPEQDINIDG